MKKIVITGGLGYIGTELCKIYSGESWNNQITVIDNRFISERVNQLRNWDIDFVHADIRNSEIVDEYLNLLISYSLSIEAESADSSLTIERYKKQKIYCLQQKLNDKTRSVLSRLFNPRWADYYIDMVLFDCPETFLD